ncbi:hypothetical protein N7468_003565 [Penicillium chermesinum]|uniref:Uncharacterized protein n=1 Tax=Penicillium chermesinum TaxID=63820 RepID=A0A9W9P7E1_9EURO|nr:uncharacterized protein N7468_003565 [Penicillium chermesinum]KAJ5238946.1 hypothetical protein N7468_003565 [Penicillium chermesinum]KAJ6164591.1 hypothetical protein N7470_003263 [Penicillium chermesinum]
MPDAALEPFSLITTTSTDVSWAADGRAAGPASHKFRLNGGDRGVPGSFNARAPTGKTQVQIETKRCMPGDKGLWARFDASATIISLVQRSKQGLRGEGGGEEGFGTKEFGLRRSSPFGFRYSAVASV